MTANEASTSIYTGAPTIASHCEHLRFYIMALHEFMLGATDKIDWKKSWFAQEVTPAEWNILRENLRRVYTTIAEYLQSLEKWGDDEVGDSMAILVHTAYHLGAIRQLMKALSQNA
jgi:hypothetical protein